MSQPIRSVWTETLASFCDNLAASRPAPAGVAAAAVSGCLGLALLMKVLEIRGLPSELIDAAKRESQILAQAADDDIEAVSQLLQAHDAQPAIEVPLRAARAAVAGLELCAGAAESVRGLIAADLGASAALLAGAARAILLCVEFNLSRAPSEALAAVRRQLEERAEFLDARISRALSR